MGMKVAEAIKRGATKLYDIKGMRIPDEIIPDITHWKVNNAPSKDKVYIIAPENICKNFYADLVGSVPKRGLYTILALSQIMEMNIDLLSAWLWSCTKYGMTQREFVNGKTYWVIE